MRKQRLRELPSILPPCPRSTTQPASVLWVFPEVIRDQLASPHLQGSHFMLLSITASGLSFELKDAAASSLWVHDSKHPSSCCQVTAQVSFPFHSLFLYSQRGDTNGESYVLLLLPRKCLPGGLSDLLLESDVWHLRSTQGHFVLSCNLFYLLSYHLLRIQNVPGDLYL